MSPTKCSAPKCLSSSADLAAWLCHFEGRESFFFLPNILWLSIYLCIDLFISKRREPLLAPSTVWMIVIAAFCRPPLQRKSVFDKYKLFLKKLCKMQLLAGSDFYVCSRPCLQEFRRQRSLFSSFVFVVVAVVGSRKLRWTRARRTSGTASLSGFFKTVMSLSSWAKQNQFFLMDSAF